MTLARELFGNDLADQCVELPPLTKEVGLVGREIIDHSGELFIALVAVAQVVAVAGKADQLELREPARQAFLYQKEHVLIEN